MKMDDSPFSNSNYAGPCQKLVSALKLEFPLLKNLEFYHGKIFVKTSFLYLRMKFYYRFSMKLGLVFIEVKQNCLGSLTWSKIKRGSSSKVPSQNFYPE